MLIILAITFPEDRPIRLFPIDFRVPENEEIYFKNMRSYYYDREDHEEAQFQLYRIESRVVDTLKPQLHFAIVLNWLQDEAYILAEPNTLLQQEDSVRIRISYTDGSAPTLLAFAHADNYAHYQFAGNLYMALREETEFSFLFEDEWRPLFPDNEGRISTKTLLKDYFRLVGKMP